MGDFLLYFAYGSNMDRKRLSDRIGSAYKWDVGMVLGKRLSFNKLGLDSTGKANLVDHEGETAYGVIYQVNESDLIKLDRFEVGYLRKTLEIRSDNNGYVQAISYLADYLPDFISPKKNYMNYIIQGAEEHGLKQNYIDSLKTIPTAD
ncbi:MAG: gamma-glutamylcyclotransferase family protein [Methanobacterium sp.]